MKKYLAISILICICYSEALAQNWQLQHSRGNLELSDLVFLNNNEGFVFGDSSISGAFITGVVLKTNDGGQNWNTFVLGNSNYRISKAFALNSNEIFAVGRNGGGNNGLFLKSTDGGQTWNTPGFFNEKLFGVFFKDSNTGWVMGKNGLLSKTTDGGSTWANQNVTSEDLFSMGFYNAATGILSCGGGELFRTTDGGISWVPVSSNVPDGLLGISFSGSNAWVCGEAGTIIFSSDEGLTWTAQSSSIPVDYNVISFPDNSNGWISGVAGIMNSTGDGGNNWQNVVSGSNADITGLSVPDVNHGWYCNTDGEIYSFNLTSSINEINGQNLIYSIYPNPATEELMITSTTKDNLTLTIINEQAQIIEKIKIESLQSTVVNCSNYASGKYFIVETQKNIPVSVSPKSFIKL